MIGPANPDDAEFQVVQVIASAAATDALAATIRELMPPIRSFRIYNMKIAFTLTTLVRKVN